MNEPPKRNSNCLVDYKCPKCQSLGPFRMDTKCVMEWHDDGTEDSGKYDQHLNIDFHGRTTCVECEHNGLTEEFHIKKRYVMCAGNHCPHCGADTGWLYVAGQLQADGPKAWQKMKCIKCNGVWEDQFRLSMLGFQEDVDYDGGSE